MTLGRGNHGHIGIVIRDMIYAKISTMPYVATLDPGGTAKVPLQAEKVQCLQLRDKHAKTHHIHNNHHNMDVALTTIFPVAVDNTYVFALHNFFTR